MGYPIANLAPTMQTTDATYQAKSNAFFSCTPLNSLTRPQTLTLFPQTLHTTAQSVINSLWGL